MFKSKAKQKREDLQLRLKKGLEHILSTPESREAIAEFFIRPMPGYHSDSNRTFFELGQVTLANKFLKALEKADQFHFLSLQSENRLRRLEVDFYEMSEDE